ncbi:hypothetical protein [Streptomyces blattellae]|nr:hypothetical protein [Streptomyces blattellae]
MPGLADQISRYGGFTTEPMPDELEQFFRLDRTTVPADATRAVG